MTMNFWQQLPQPIIGLSPMDGVTDFACRYITARYGKPHVMFTEFVTVEGLLHAPERILKDFEYDEIERQIVAQIISAHFSYPHFSVRIVPGKKHGIPKTSREFLKITAVFFHRINGGAPVVAFIANVAR